MSATTVEQVRDALPDYARDLRLNLGSVLTPQGAPGLSPKQIWGSAYAAAIAARHRGFTQVIEAAASAELDAAALQGVRAAAAIMGMNNVYYRFLHLCGDAEYQSMPARLRMNVIASPGIDKVDFELYCLVASAVNGCGLCIESHEKVLRKHELGREAIQSAIRIASVIHAVAVVLEQDPGVAEALQLAA